MLFFVLLKVADFLAKRRDNMFLEFDISISHSVRDTFLSTGNEAAYKVSGKRAWKRSIDSVLQPKQSHRVIKTLTYVTITKSHVKLEVNIQS